MNDESKKEMFELFDNIIKIISNVLVEFNHQEKHRIFLRIFLNQNIFNDQLYLQFKYINKLKKEILFNNNQLQNKLLNLYKSTNKSISYNKFLVIISINQRATLRLQQMVKCHLYKIFQMFTLFPNVLQAQMLSNRFYQRAKELLNLSRIYNDFNKLIEKFLKWFMEEDYKQIQQVQMIEDKFGLQNLMNVLNKKGEIEQSQIQWKKKDSEKIRNQFRRVVNKVRIANILKKLPMNQRLKKQRLSTMLKSIQEKNLLENNQKEQLEQFIQTYHKYQIKNDKFRLSKTLKKISLKNINFEKMKKELQNCCSKVGSEYKDPLIQLNFKQKKEGIIVPILKKQDKQKKEQYGKKQISFKKKRGTVEIKKGNIVKKKKNNSEQHKSSISFQQSQQPNYIPIISNNNKIFNIKQKLNQQSIQDSPKIIPENNYVIKSSNISNHNIINNQKKAKKIIYVNSFSKAKRKSKKYQVERIIRQKMQKYKNQIIRQQKNRILIDVPKLLKNSKIPLGNNIKVNISLAKFYLQEMGMTSSKQTCLKQILRLKLVNFNNNQTENI